jgi:hypothetical protein
MKSEDMRFRRQKPMLFFIFFHRDESSGGHDLRLWLFLINRGERQFPAESGILAGIKRATEFDHLHLRQYR